MGTIVALPIIGCVSFVGIFFITGNTFLLAGDCSYLNFIGARVNLYVCIE